MPGMGSGENTTHAAAPPSDANQTDSNRHSRAKAREKSYGTDVQHDAGNVQLGTIHRADDGRSGCSLDRRVGQWAGG